MITSPDSTLADATVAYPVSDGGHELAMRHAAFHQHLATNVAAAQAAVMGATQRPATDAGLSGGPSTDVPAWRKISSWFVIGDKDLIIPVALHRSMAARAGAKVSRELAGRSYALSVSEPEAATATILDAVASAWRTDVRALQRPGPGDGVIDRRVDPVVAHEVAPHTSTRRVDAMRSDAGRRYPIVGSESGGGYDRFRAVHDILGHARLCPGFDRDGESASRSGSPRAKET